MRRKIIDYIKKKYKAEPEHLWRSYPDYIVFRHSDNNKWFGIIMDVSRDKLGLDGDDRVDIIDDDRIMIACCNDGTRPVIFKIERIDIPETPEEEWLSKQDFHNGADQAYTG